MIFLIHLAAGINWPYNLRIEKWTNQIMHPILTLTFVYTRNRYFHWLLAFRCVCARVCAHMRVVHMCLCDVYLCVLPFMDKHAENRGRHWGVFFYCFLTYSLETRSLTHPKASPFGSACWPVNSKDLPISAPQNACLSSRCWSTPLSPQPRKQIFRH